MSASDSRLASSRITAPSSLRRSPDRNARNEIELFLLGLQKERVLLRDGQVGECRAIITASPYRHLYCTKVSATIPRTGIVRHAEGVVADAVIAQKEIIVFDRWDRPRSAQPP